MANAIHARFLCLFSAPFYQIRYIHAVMLFCFMEFGNQYDMRF